MDHETAYALMMDALDGELPEEEYMTLEVYLQAHPTLDREWQAMQAIDTLFRQTPALAPAADFAQRTMARLPNRRFRLGVVGAMYGLLAFSGFLPLLVGGILAIALFPIPNQAIVWQSLSQAFIEAAQIGFTVIGALFTALGQFLVQEPIVVGSLLIMAGIVSIWGGVYQQVMGQPRALQTTV